MSPRHTRQATLFTCHVNLFEGGKWLVSVTVTGGGMHATEYLDLCKYDSLRWDICLDLFELSYSFLF